MTKGVSSARELIRSCLNDYDLDTQNGISLISLKHNILLSYVHSLTLLSSYRLLGRSLSARTRPEEPFTDPKRKVRGSDAGDLVDVLLEDRIILEKLKQLESKMRYQIQKLVQSGLSEETDVLNDPLVFRPNPEKLAEQSSDEESSPETTKEDGQKFYQPPKLAPMPYTEDKPSRSKKRAPLPAGLAGLQFQDGTNPHAESASGLGSIPSLASARARELARITEYEEENMTRLVMTKKEARRRARDEEDIALGGTGVSRGRHRGDNLASEFNSILHSIDQRTTSRGAGDGYEALRTKARKKDAFSRSRMREFDDEDGDAGDHRPTKKGRFQLAVRSLSRKKKRSGK